MGRSSGNYRIKQKLIESLKQIEDPDNFDLYEIVSFYEREHRTVYKSNRIASLLKPYAFAVGTRRNRHWVIKEKWRHLYEEENCNS
jgi:hypothetical protein